MEISTIIRFDGIESDIKYIDDKLVYNSNVKNYPFCLNISIDTLRRMERNNDYIIIDKFNNLKMISSIKILDKDIIVVPEISIISVSGGNQEIINEVQMLLWVKVFVHIYPLLSEYYFSNLEINEYILCDGNDNLELYKNNTNFIVHKITDRKISQEKIYKKPIMSNIVVSILNHYGYNLDTSINYIILTDIPVDSTYDTINYFVQNNKNSDIVISGLVCNKLNIIGNNINNEYSYNFENCKIGVVNFYDHYICITTIINDLRNGLIKLFSGNVHRENYNKLLGIKYQSSPIFVSIKNLDASLLDSYHNIILHNSTVNYDIFVRQNEILSTSDILDCNNSKILYNLSSHKSNLIINNVVNYSCIKLIGKAIIDNDVDENIGQYKLQLSNIDRYRIVLDRIFKFMSVIVDDEMNTMNENIIYEKCVIRSLVLSNMVKNIKFIDCIFENTVPIKITNINKITISQCVNVGMHTLCVDDIYKIKIDKKIVVKKPFLKKYISNIYDTLDDLVFHIINSTFNRLNKIILKNVQINIILNCDWYEYVRLHNCYIKEIINNRNRNVVLKSCIVGNYCL